MKFITQPDSIIIKSKGLYQLLAAIGVILLGAGIGYFMLTQPSEESSSPLFLLIPLGVAVLGIFLLFSARNRTVTLSKNAESSVYEKRVIGGKSSKDTFKLGDVVAVQLSTHRDRGTRSSNGRRRQGQLVSVVHLVLNDNSQIRIAQKKKSGGFSINGLNVGQLIQKAPLNKEATQIANFIGVPLQASTAGSAMDAVTSAIGAMTGSNAPNAPMQATQNPTPQQPVQPRAQQPSPAPSQPVQPQAPQQQPPQSSQTVQPQATQQQPPVPTPQTINPETQQPGQSTPPKPQA